MLNAKDFEAILSMETSWLLSLTNVGNHISSATLIGIVIILVF